MVIKTMTPTKQKIIDEIIIEIESGKSYTEVLAVNGRKWRLAQRTFERYWKEANEQYKVVQDKRRVITETITTQAHIEALERGVMSRKEKLEILENIAKGNDFEKYFIQNGKPQKTISKPDLADRMKAIEIHNKMQGDNAPDESSTTIKSESSVLDWVLSKKK